MSIKFSHKIWGIVQGQRGEQLFRMPAFKEITEKEGLDNKNKRLHERQRKIR